MVHAGNRHPLSGIDRIERFNAETLEIDRLPKAPLQFVQFRQPARRDQGLRAPPQPKEATAGNVGRSTAEEYASGPIATVQKSGQSVPNGHEFNPAVPVSAGSPTDALSVAGCYGRKATTNTQDSDRP